MRLERTPPPTGSRAAVQLRLLDRAGARALLDSAPGQARWAPGYPATGDLEAAGALLGEIDAGHDPGGFGTYEVLDCGSGEVVGGIGFHAPPSPEGVVEVGYGIVDSRAGRGFATAALRAMFDIAWRLGAERVIARALPSNAASRRVMERAGMDFTGLDAGYACYERRH